MPAQQLEQRNQSPQLDKTDSPGNHNQAHSDGCEALNAASISEDKRHSLLISDHTVLDPVTLQEPYLVPHHSPDYYHPNTSVHLHSAEEYFNLCSLVCINSESKLFIKRKKDPPHTISTSQFPGIK